MDEFRTSKVDSVDDSVLQLVGQKVDGVQARRSFRGVLWSVTRQKFVSRDLNAALNIRRCLLNRPTILKRASANGRLEQAIVKRVKRRQS